MKINLRRLTIDEYGSLSKPISIDIKSNLYRDRIEQDRHLRGIDIDPPRLRNHKLGSIENRTNTGVQRDRGGWESVTWRETCSLSLEACFHSASMAPRLRLSGAKSRGALTGRGEDGRACRVGSLSPFSPFFPLLFLRLVLRLDDDDEGLGKDGSLVAPPMLVSFSWWLAWLAHGRRWRTHEPRPLPPPWPINGAVVAGPPVGGGGGTSPTLTRLGVMAALRTTSPGVALWPVPKRKRSTRVAH